MTESLRVAAIVGPTAVGKTELSLEVAEMLGAEIVSLDSMQVYTGMDIGTAKPSGRERARVPHHLIDVFPPSYDLTVAEFQSLARSAIDEIAGRGALPLLVGGSGLYFRAVVDDLAFPPRDDEVRAGLEDEFERLGAEALHERLRVLDAAAAERIEPANARRTIRALEVIELTGRPFSENTGWESYDSRYSLKVAGLRRDREELRSRIEARVTEMIDRGLAEEVARVAGAGMSRTARQALGYRQVLEAEPGASPADVAEAIARATARFARRQESWFKSDPRVEWFDAAAPETAARVLAYLSQR